DPMAIILSLIALGLLALIIYLLHTHQQQQKIDAVDRTIPLPPLEGDITLPGTEAPAAIRRTEPAPNPKMTTIPAPEPPPAPVPEPEPEPELPETSQPPADWLARNRALKDQGEFDQALEIVRSAYPQIGAFRHACVILRAQLRELRK